MGLPAVKVDEFQRKRDEAIGAGVEGAVGGFHGAKLARGEQVGAAGRMPVVAAMGAEESVERGEIGEGEGDEVAVDHRQGQFEALEQGAAFLDIRQRRGAGGSGKACGVEGVAEFRKACCPQGAGEEKAIWGEVLEVLVEGGDGVILRGEGEVGEEKVVGVGGWPVVGGGVKGLGGACIGRDVEDGGEAAFGVGKAVGEAAGAFGKKWRGAAPAGVDTFKVVGGEGKFRHAGHHARESSV